MRLLRQLVTLPSILLALSAVPTMAADPASEAPTATPRPADGRPNIILLIGDDHGYPYFGFTGSDIVQTPNLDALSAGGTTFTRAHVTASICPPSLNTLLTGLYPVQWDRRIVQLRASGKQDVRRHTAIQHVATLPRVLAERGYVTFQAGKFSDGSATQAGFTSGTVTDPKDAHGGGDHQFGRESIEPALGFIDQNAGRPFFVWFAPKLPHIPLNAPERHREIYRDKGLSALAAAYYANCTWFDDLVGQLVQHLESRGLRQNTLLVYVSDNGYDQPPETKRKGTKGKFTLHEQGFRTPLIFNWPGHVPAGQVIDRFVSSVDLFPTLCDFAGVETRPPGRRGIDLKPLIEGGSAPRRSELIGHMKRRDQVNGYYLTDDRWHFTWDLVTGQEELFDKTVDPEEDRNVIADHPDVATGLRERIRRWKRDVTAPFARVPATPQPTPLDPEAAERPDP